MVQYKVHGTLQELSEDIPSRFFRPYSTPNLEASVGHLRSVAKHIAPCEDMLNHLSIINYYRG